MKSITANRLRRSRKLAKVTANEVSKKTGIALMTIYSYERGESSPPIDKLIKLAEYYQESPSYYLGVKSALHDEDDTVEEYVSDLSKEFLNLDVKQRRLVMKLAIHHAKELQKI